MDIKECDVCKKIFAPASDYKEYRLPDTKLKETYRLFSGADCFNASNFDLCPECHNKLYDFIKELKAGNHE